MVSQIRAAKNDISEPGKLAMKTSAIVCGSCKNFNLIYLFSKIIFKYKANQIKLLRCASNYSAYIACCEYSYGFYWSSIQGPMHHTALHTNLVDCDGRGWHSSCLDKVYSKPIYLFCVSCNFFFSITQVKFNIKTFLLYKDSVRLVRLRGQ